MATSSEKNKIMKLSTAEYTTLSTTGTLTKDGVTYTYSPSDTIYVTPDAISGLSEYKEQLRLICNRYLDSTDRLPIDCTWEDLIAVFNEYDEYSYMNAFLNSIEVFPDKDYSINDTEGHIKGLRQQAFYGNTALKSVDMRGITSISVAQPFGYCSSLKTVFLPSLLSSTGNQVFYNSTSLENIAMAKIQAINANNVFQGLPSLKTILIGGICTIDGSTGISSSVPLQALIFTNQSDYSTISSSNIANQIISSPNCIVYVPSAMLTAYQSRTNFTTINASRPIQQIESNINSLRELGVDFSFTPYANKKWENNQLVDDATIGEVTL